LESCALNVEKAFVENELPFFIDQANTMSHHPILEFISSLFLLKKNHYRLDDVFRFLRTELFIPDYDGKDTSKEAYQRQSNELRQEIDIAENVALAYGYHGNDWIKNEEWIYMDRALDEESPLNDHDQKIQDTANRVRQAVKDYIVPF